MTQSPYANIGNEMVETPAQRTSVMAILSLIIAIVSIIPFFCLFPGSGALAVILGGAALLFINRERGRLSGTGMAATGIVLGLVVTVLQIVGVMMITRAGQMVTTTMMAPVTNAMKAMESGDLKGARQLFTPAADARISDEQLKDFVANYQAAAGPFKQAPDSLFKLISAYMTLGPLMQQMQGRNDVVPFPAEFGNGPALMLLVVDPQAAPGGPPGSPGFAIPLQNIGILTTDGKQVWIIDPKTMPGTPGLPGLPPPAAPTPPTGSNGVPPATGDSGSGDQDPAGDDPVEPSDPAKPG